MKSTGRLAGAVMALTLAVPSVAGAANKEHQQLMAEIRMLQEQQQQLQQMLGGLADTLKVMTTRLDSDADATRKAFADQKLLVNGIGDTVRVLREKADDTNVRLSTMTQELQALRQTVASMPAPQGPPRAVTTDPAAGDPAAAAGARRPGGRRAPALEHLPDPDVPTSRTPTTAPASSTWRSMGSRRSSARSRRRRTPTKRSSTSATRSTTPARTPRRSPRSRR